MPLPRYRINHPKSSIADGDHLFVTLKDKSRHFTEDEKEWYE